MTERDLPADLADSDDADDFDGDDVDDNAENAENADNADLDDQGRRWPKVLPTVFPGPPSWPSIFGRTAPLECEIGFGRPHFILERAAEVPEHDIVGIEWKGRWPRAVWKKQTSKSTQQQYRNVRALHGNAWLLFGALFQPASLDLIVINFPDPWWKTKHQKRRIISEPFAKLLASRVRVGGRILIQTDVASLLEEYLERLEALPNVKNIHGPFRLVPKKPTRAASHREKRCQKDGIPIFRALLERTS